MNWRIRTGLSLWLLTLAIMAATCVAGPPAQAATCPKGYELQRGQCVPIQKKAVPGSWVTCTLPMQPVCDYRTGLCWCRYRSK